MSFWATPAKDIPRQVVMDRQLLPYKKRRAAKTALTLPGSQLLCVNAGIKSGLFNRNTLHLFVERRSPVYGHIQRRVEKLNLAVAPRLWRDEIHKLPLRASLDNLPLDFAYLDLCAAINQHTSRWILTELGPALSSGATVAVTICRNWRTSQFMKWWTAAVTRRGSAARTFWQETEQLVYAADCAGRVGNQLDYYDDDGEYVDGFTIPNRGLSRWNQRLLPEYHDSSVDAISAFLLLLPMHDYKLESCIEYQRSANQNTYMTTFILTEIEPAIRPRVPESLLYQVGQNMSPQLVRGGYWRE